MMEAKRRREHRSMLPVTPDGAAIDVGAAVHVGAVGPARDAEPVRSLGTFTGDLYRLTDWFAQCGIKTVVMESTGVYWIPIYEILEQRGFEVRVVNARDAKHVPGRKTDVSDAAWLQRLHEFGLLRGSSGRRVLSLPCVPISPTLSDYCTPQPSTFSICRKHSLR